MSVTSGFFNSLNRDRRYNAQQFSSLFDGIINDGVFANIGVAFAITVDSGVTINIGVGKAWFNSAWVYNDALLPKTLEGSEVVLDRIDAVVIEVDHNESVRLGDIKIVKGTPSSDPKRPAMANETNKHQHPLAYIYRKAGSTAITQADITNMVGTSECPYITGILQVQNIDNIVAQWNAQWNQWYAEKVAQTDTDSSELMAEMKSEFDIWFADVQALLEDDVATALAAEVAALQSKFDDLARDGCVYDVIEDSDLDVILGSDGTPLQGKTVLGGGGNTEDIDLSGYAKKVELEAVAESKLDRTEKSVRSILDNSDFTQFIAQAGIGGNHGTKAYAGDRWILDSGTVTGEANANGNGYSNIKLTGTIRQIIENPPAVGSVFVETVSGTATAVYENGAVKITSNGGVLKNVALYAGQYATANKPKYQPKGYGAEFAECQRYYIHSVGRCVAGYGVNGRSTLQVYIPTPVTMRVKPSATLVRANDFVINTGNIIPVTGVSTNVLMDNGVLCILNTSTLTSHVIGVTGADTNISLIADFKEDI